MRFPQPNARFQHVFVIIRLDGDEPLAESSITLTKAFLTEEAAEAEAQRLNELNAQWSKKYFVSVARLVEDLPALTSPEKKQA